MAYSALLTTPDEYTSTWMDDSFPQPSAPSEEIAGVVEWVPHFNKESGYAVLKVNIRGQQDQVTVVGTLPLVNVGE